MHVSAGHFDLSCEALAPLKEKHKALLPGSFNSFSCKANSSPSTSRHCCAAGSAPTRLPGSNVYSECEKGWRTERRCGWKENQQPHFFLTGKNVKAWQESRTTGKQAEKIKHSVEATCWLMDSMALASATDQKQVTGMSYSWASVHTAVKFLHSA